MPLQKIINDNIETLQTMAQLIEPLSNRDYQRITKPLFSSSIGAHIRHLLEHYQQFFSGIENGKIDYDLRPRQQRLEANPNRATATIKQLIDQLQQLCQRSDNKELVPIGVYHASSTSDKQPLFLTSSIERELLFLLSHCNHHLAIIAAILRYIEIAVQPALGIAPSTIIFNQQQTASSK